MKKVIRLSFAVLFLCLCFSNSVFADAEITPATQNEFSQKVESYYDGSEDVLTSSIESTAKFYILSGNGDFSSDKLVGDLIWLYMEGNTGSFNPNYLSPLVIPDDCTFNIIIGISNSTEPNAPNYVNLPEGITIGKGSNLNVYGQTSDPVKNYIDFDTDGTISGGGNLYLFSGMLQPYSSTDTNAISVNTITVSGGVLNLGNNVEGSEQPAISVSTTVFIDGGIVRSFNNKGDGYPLCPLGGEDPVTIDGNCFVAADGLDPEDVKEGLVVSSGTFTSGDGTVKGNITTDWPSDLVGKTYNFDNLNVDKDATLTIPDDYSVNVADDFTNDGTVENAGNIQLKGDSTNNGTVKNTGTVTVSDTGSLNNSGVILNTGEGDLQQNGAVANTGLIVGGSADTTEEENTVKVETSNEDEGTVTIKLYEPEEDEPVALAEEESPESVKGNPEQLVEITAIPNDGFKFDYWEVALNQTDGDPIILNGSGSIYGQVLDNILNPPDVYPDGGITPKNPKIIVYLSGNLTFTANFKGANTDTPGGTTPGGSGGGTSNPSTSKVKVTVNQATGGTVTGGGSVTKGSRVTLTATPAEGYQFDGWSVNGTIISTANPYTFTANSNTTITPVFSKITVNPDTPNQPTTNVAIYRLYLPTTNEHLYTPFKSEVDTLVTRGWQYEDVDWYAPETGTPVYRLYNPSTYQHLYTADTNEVNTLTHGYGWIEDNSGKPFFYSGGNVGIYRLFLPYHTSANQLPPNADVGLHLLTTNAYEYNYLQTIGWKPESIKLYGVAAGN